MRGGPPRVYWAGSTALSGKKSRNVTAGSCTAAPHASYIAGHLTPTSGHRDDSGADEMSAPCRPVERVEAGRLPAGRAPRATAPATTGPGPAAAGPLARRVGDAHRQLSALEVLIVQLADGLLGLGRGGHLDEPEAPGLSGEPVGDHRGGFHGAALAE